MPFTVQSVAPRSCAADMGVLAGDVVLKVNGEELIDQIDYQALLACEDVTLLLRRGDETLELSADKDEDEPLGLAFEQPLLGEPRRCKNKCVFCFIDQMPPGLRPTLYTKDDDWRYSLIMGNYITLTNADDEEFERILRRKPSPLYISCHATDGDVRARMMANPAARQLLPRLRALAKAGIRFHCQIVLCPGINDGPELEKTLGDLAALYPAAQSVAIVPVGLTKFREGLYPLRPFTIGQARDALRIAKRFRRECYKKWGTRFVFPSDEMYLQAESKLPAYESYEDFGQIENGVGLLRLLEHDYLEALPDLEPAAPRSVAVLTGVSAAPFLEELFVGHPSKGVSVRVYPVRNDFFGETVTVAGLLTAGDLSRAIRTLRAEDPAWPPDEVLLSGCMLRADEDVFLDGGTLSQVRKEAGVPVRPAPSSGSGIAAALAGVPDPEEEPDA